MGFKPFQCEKCPASFSSYGRRWEHISIVHDEAAKRKIVMEQKDWICKYIIPSDDGDVANDKVCLTVFKSQMELKEHQLEHKKDSSFICKYCNRTFSNYSNKLSHEAKHRAGQEFNKCTKPYGYDLQFRALTNCNLVFNTVEEFTEHQLKEHGTSYKCPLCNVRFRGPYNLVNHVPKHLSDTTILGKADELTFACDYQINKETYLKVETEA